MPGLPQGPLYMHGDSRGGAAGRPLDFICKVLGVEFVSFDWGWELASPDAADT